MRLTKEEMYILLTLLDTQVMSIRKEEILEQIEDGDCFGVKSWKQADKLNSKLWKKYRQLETKKVTQ
jgi:hypothetical protein